MIVIRIIFYLLGLYIGTGITAYLLTHVELASHKLQRGIEKFSRIIPKIVWVLLAAASYAYFSYLLLPMLGWKYFRVGVLVGLISGIFIFFRLNSHFEKER
ncbi:MAG: hypothetical protein ACOYJO_05045 [Eubacterium sp.]|jgi:integral membrane sensor domain MASE1